MGVESGMRILNRDVIKYAAMLAMLLNHIANIFLAPGTPLYKLFLNIGYFTAVTMCYFLVEGYEYTRSKEKYGRRLLVFAVLSQIPYSMAFADGKWIELNGFNMLFTLYLCFRLIQVMDQVKVREERFARIAVIFLLAVFCDWFVLAPAFTMLFVRAKDSGKKNSAAFLASMGMFFAVKFLGGIGMVPLGENLADSIYAVLGIGLSGIVILYLYNGRRMEAGRTFSKWFFYLFYPVHLLVLGIIRIWWKC